MDPASKPVLLTVDDDPSVSRAVARDLRRRYGQDYRVVRADSGPDALDALKEIRLRGDRVAVLLADYRMPMMTGIEFLEQAMDLFPRARRALLTAYADTDAAIAAINVVDVDHYLLKPWEPPEEKLYPVIDALLEPGGPPGTAPVEHTQVVGHRWIAAVVRGPRLPGPQPASPTAGSTRTSRTAGGCSAAADAGPDVVPLVVDPDGHRAGQPDGQRAGRPGRPDHAFRPATSTTW